MRLTVTSIADALAGDVPEQVRLAAGVAERRVLRALGGGQRRPESSRCPCSCSPRRRPGRCRGSAPRCAARCSPRSTVEMPAGTDPTGNGSVFGPIQSLFPVMPPAWMRDGASTPGRTGRNTPLGAPPARDDRVAREARCRCRRRSRTARRGTAPCSRGPRARRRTPRPRPRSSSSRRSPGRPPRRRRTTAAPPGRRRDARATRASWRPSASTGSAISSFQSSGTDDVSERLVTRQELDVDVAQRAAVVRVLELDDRGERPGDHDLTRAERRPEVHDAPSAACAG